MRILYDNAADRAAITLPGTAPGLGPSNLKTDVRSEVCRVQSGTATITASWPAGERINTVVLAAAVLSPTATVRVRLYGAEDVLLVDSGVQPANPSGRMGRPVDVAVYLSDVAIARRLVVTLADPGSTFLDLPRLIAGEALTVRYGATYGAGRVIEDTGSHQRSAAGDLRTELGTLAPTLQFELSAVHEDDHGLLLDILEAGIGRTMWVDLLTHEYAPSVQRSMRIYGRQDRGGALPMIAPSLYQTRFLFLGW